MVAIGFDRQANVEEGELLISYFKGEAEPIVQPVRAGMMKGYIEKTKALSDAERKALADSIMSYSK